MKNVVYAIVIILMGSIILITIISATSTMNRHTEIDNSLQQAVETSIERCVTTKHYSLDDNRQFIADLIRNISNAVENDSDLSVDVMEADKDKGYLAIRVTQVYNTHFLQKKTAVYETVAYLEKSTQIPMLDTINVRFEKKNGELIAKKTVISGEKITPVESEGFYYSYWENKITKERIEKTASYLDIAGNEDVVYVAM